MAKIRKFSGLTTEILAKNKRLKMRICLKIEMGGIHKRGIFGKLVGSEHRTDWPEKRGS